MSENILFNAVVNGDRERVIKAIQEAIENGEKADIILQEGIVKGMAEVGRLFEEGEYFVPEMLIAARAVKDGLQVLKPYLQLADIQPRGKILIGTVKGDLHDIGKNLVSIMLEGAGYQIIDLGVDVDAALFLEKTKEEKPDVLALSALLTTTMTNMTNVVKTIRNEKQTRNVKIIIGGAPVTQNFADEIGADGYSMDASQAVRLVNSLMQR
ncbi:MAG: cobalamin-binding protein [Pelolinea sp.]|jgi:5-methyltetrahydrofolate--homocysteine methyltransferase|nr:cobalamin-binding protein [Pelolinea sp.]